MTAKKWVAGMLGVFLLAAVLLGGLVAVVDPFFHFHKPLPFLAYPLDKSEQRYVNDGIVKHFTYDALITGSSMSESFLASELDGLFDVNSIKVPMSGSSFREGRDLVWTAAEENPDLKMVVRSLDANYLLWGMDYQTPFDSPDYLYDRNPFNDVNYLFNKTVIFDNVAEVLDYTKKGFKTTDFDVYSSWGGVFDYGAEAVLKNYVRAEKVDKQASFDERFASDIRENMYQNFVSVAMEYRDVQFYIFYPPYSAVWWDEIQRQGELERTLGALETAADELLQWDNIHVFSFMDDYDTIFNLDNYKDYIHYSPDINSKILRCMKDGTHRLTRDNNAAYWREIGEYYGAFDFDTYMAEQGCTEPAVEQNTRN